MCIDRVRDMLGVSERGAYRVLGQHQSTQLHVPKGRGDEEQLNADTVELAREFGRYGYRRIARQRRFILISTDFLCKFSEIGPLLRGRKFFANFMIELHPRKLLIFIYSSELIFILNIKIERTWLSIAHS